MLYPDPGFPFYRSMIEFSGATPVPFPLEEARGFSFDPERVLNQITDQDPAHHPQQPRQPDWWCCRSCRAQRSCGRSG